MLKMLYFNTLYAFLRGDLEATRMYFNFLKEESTGKDIRDILDIQKLKKLRDIRQSISTGNISTKQFIDQENIDMDPPEETSSLRQIDIVKRIHEDAFDDLKKILGEKNLSLYNIEHPCDRYGRVDMVYSGGGIMYPLEVKIREGRHDIIGQIEKYIKHFMFKLHYNLYEGVKGITVCRSYEGHVLEDLKRINVLPLIYHFSGDRVRLKVV